MLLVLCLLVTTSPLASVRADGDPPAAAACGLDGLWTTRNGGFTTRIASGRWQTWSGITGIDVSTPPAVQGWLEVTSERLTFDYDSGQTGYSYAYSFEDGCDVLHIRLDASSIEYVFTRGPS